MRQEKTEEDELMDNIKLDHMFNEPTEYTVEVIRFVTDAKELKRDKKRGHAENRDSDQMGR